MASKGTTAIGFVNGNNQKNNGPTGEPGTDHMQNFYSMKCLDCGFQYKANGSDIYRKVYI